MYIAVSDNENPLKKQQMNEMNKIQFLYENNDATLKDLSPFSAF